ncbi:amidohydrolase family protein [Pseudonocardia sp.]|uniref:amidohydrolase family protein n=1 Tax=Pseudonocardia sp. TaxID=60912 RepID=UPI003D137E52
MSAPAELDDLADRIAALPLIDHHVHGAFTTEIDRAAFEMHLNEGSPEPAPAGTTQFDSPVGFAIRRWCAPLLDLPPHTPADRYWARRTELGTAEVTARFLRAAGVSDWLVDTGYAADAVLDPAALAAASGGAVREIVRIEAVAEQVAARAPAGRDYADTFGAQLAQATRGAAGVKSVLAYRAGFDIDLTRPDPRQVAVAAARWIGAGGGRLTDPVLLRHGLHTALRCGLPLQLHTGLGDRDLDLHRANPVLLLDLLRLPEVAAVPVMLLHCYPYHREAAYLAQAFPNVHMDVGLALNHVGARSRAVLAESFELAPFAKLLYSSDAWGPAELHHLGAVLWRRAITATFGEWVRDGDWSAADAQRVATMVGRGNAERVYRL